jgi:large subunit ribosomal protein L6
MEAERLVEIPEGVDVKLEGRRLTVTGENGSLTRDFSHAPLTLEREAQLIRIRAEWPRKKEAATVGTVSSHIHNMMKGVIAGFTYKLKIVFSHFPISVKVEDDQIRIENFTGERSPRFANIVGDVTVSVKSDDIIVKGIDLEAVSQTAANVQQATKVKKKDPRVFLDGIYVYEQREGMRDD